MPHCLLRLLLCLCLVANTATGAWASVGMAMPAMGSAAMGSAARGMHAAAPDALPCHEDMASPAAMPLPDPDHAQHAGKGDCCKLGSCDCLQHCSLALLTLPAVPAALAGRPAMPGALAEGARTRCPSNRSDLPSPEPRRQQPSSPLRACAGPIAMRVACTL